MQLEAIAFNSVDTEHFSKVLLDGSGLKEFIFKMKFTENMVESGVILVISIV